MVMVSVLNGIETKEDEKIYVDIHDKD